MNDTPDAGSSALPAAARDNTTAPAALPLQRTVRVQFTGSGSEYMRIWVVNAALTLLTLSLYYPFAKARRLRWMHANTLVDGQALGFHGNPWKMLRGYLLMLAFAASYGLADHFKSSARLAALVAFAALWPALWQSSLRFRLANTSWRGLRMRFTGSAADAYRALLPALLPLLALALLNAVLGEQLAHYAPAPKGAAADGFGRYWLTWLNLLGVPLLAAALLPWLSARAKRYQHGHYTWANQTTTLTARTGEFYRIWFHVLLIALVPFLGLTILVAIKLPMAGTLHGRSTLLALAALGLLTYLAVMLAGRAFLVARLQDLVWSGTRSPDLQFISNLHASELGWLMLKNLVFTALTLGFYWPFAQVQLARLRLEQVRVVVQGDPAHWHAAASAGATRDTAGDAAGDLLGIDIGL